MAQEFTFTWRGPAVKRGQRAGAAQGLIRAAEYVLQRSRAVTPIEEGILRASGRASVDSAALEAAISYDTPYAVRQHEDMSLRHKDGQAKYLEGPLNAAQATIQDLVAASIRRSLGGGL